jgi:hypothetical protein
MTCLLNGCMVHIQEANLNFVCDAYKVGFTWILRGNPGLGQDTLGREADISIDPRGEELVWYREDLGIVVIDEAQVSIVSERLRTVTENYDKLIEAAFDEENKNIDFVPTRAGFAALFNLLQPDGKEEEVVTVDSYQPDYAQKCANCGQSPTVTGVKGGEVVLDIGLCGPCCWGEAKTADPKVWNE